MVEFYKGKRRDNRSCSTKALRARAKYDKRKSSAQLYREFGVDDIERRWEEQDAIWLYRIVKDDPGVPRYMKDLVTFSKGSYNFRQKNIEIGGKSKLIETTFSWGLKCLYEQLPVSILDVKSYL